MAREQKIVYIGKTIPEGLKAGVVVVVESVEKLPTQGVWAIVVGREHSWNKLEILTQIRSKPDYRLLPVFSEAELNTEEYDLFDGECDSQLQDKAWAIHDRVVQVSADNKTSELPEVQLICYLFCRPAIKVSGKINYHNPKLFEYPLLDILFAQAPFVDSWRFLEDQVVSNWLAPCMLHNEIKTCHSCHSGLLNIKNTCPSCHSVNVKKQQFVHCYTCGKIGPVPEFLRKERLYCVRCNTHLQTLGVDFDKPEEDKLCLDCGHYFSETVLSYLCLVCKQEQLENELASRKLFDYVLTSQAECVVSGIERGIFSNYNQTFKYIDYSTFMAIVGWQAALSERYPSTFFSVMTVQIANASELTEAHGLVHVEKLAGELFFDLRNLFRDMDISARHNGAMYFFLPMTELEGYAAIVSRIKLLLDKRAKAHRDEGLALSLSYISSAEIVGAQPGGQMLLDDMHSRILKSNSCLLG